MHNESAHAGQAAREETADLKMLFFWFRLKRFTAAVSSGALSHYLAGPFQALTAWRSIYTGHVVSHQIRPGTPLLAYHCNLDLLKHGKIHCTFGDAVLTNACTIPPLGFRIMPMHCDIARSCKGAMPDHVCAKVTLSGG